MPSFDIVSEVNRQEVVNAVDQANRELRQRFDFKGVDAEYALEELTITQSAPSDFQLKQMLDILKARLIARGIDARCLDVKDPEVNLARATGSRNRSSRSTPRFRARSCACRARSAMTCRRRLPS